MHDRPGKDLIRHSEQTGKPARRAPRPTGRYYGCRRIRQAVIKNCRPAGPGSRWRRPMRSVHDQHASRDASRPTVQATSMEFRRMEAGAGPATLPRVPAAGDFASARAGGPTASRAAGERTRTVYTCACEARHRVAAMSKPMCAHPRPGGPGRGVPSSGRQVGRRRVAHHARRPRRASRRPRVDPIGRHRLLRPQNLAPTATAA